MPYKKKHTVTHPSPSITYRAAMALRIGADAQQVKDASREVFEWYIDQQLIGLPAATSDALRREFDALDFGGLADRWFVLLRLRERGVKLEAM